MRHLNLAEEQRQERQRISRQAVGRVALPARMALFRGWGDPAPRIAPIHARGHDQAALWRHR